MNFTVNKPLQGHDEDAPAYADGKMLVVCDGLGGGGQNAYIVDGKKRTSAYLGSRQISQAFISFCGLHYDEFCSNMRSPEFLVTELKDYIGTKLDSYVAEKGLKNIVRGKSMQMLPSTLAAVIYNVCSDHTDALVISAGDSRAFVLTPENGLQQISCDDVFENVDAFEKSATMTNNIRQDGAFHLNYSYYKLPPRCILLVCTDGCFDYISTPMELEYRLEYSINKCQNLFDPDKDNLGGYFGNILVSSGLKDDCTMAGAIIGYSDFELTKKLFLERAMMLQERYRKPCAECDRESAKRKAESLPEIPEIESQIRSLKAEADAVIGSSIIQAFEADINESSFVSEPLSSLLESLAEFEPYESFTEDLRQKDEEKRKEISDKEKAYDNCRSHLRRIFKSMRFEEFVNNLINNNPFTNILGTNTERSRMASEYKRLKESCGRARELYEQAVKDFSETFDRFISLNPQRQMTREEILPSVKGISELQSVYGEYVTLRQELAIYSENLKSFYIESDMAVEQEFNNAWRSRFSAYTRCPQYKEIRAEYDKCIEIQEEIENARPLDADEKLIKFKQYFENHKNSFLNMVKNNRRLLRLLCAETEVKAEELQSRCEELNEYALEPERKKYALWLEYKPVYELFNHGFGGKV